MAGSIQGGLTPNEQPTIVSQAILIAKDNTMPIEFLFAMHDASARCRL